MSYFEKLGYTEKDIAKRIEDEFNALFYGDETVRIYHEKDDLGWLEDTGNNDVRTEGMSYGMMIAVQLDKKELFDRLWRWVNRYMLMTSGANAGYFRWSCFNDGRSNSEGSAPDGEEFFAMALLFAEKRWGNGTGELDYGKQARDLLTQMVHKGDPSDTSGGQPMFDPKTTYIKFVAEMAISDPSYHVPHFYDLYAKYGNEIDRDFFKRAAVDSRDYLLKAMNAETGMAAEYANYDGTPAIVRGHDKFFSDSYRVSANIGLDWAWFGVNSALKPRVKALQKFYKPLITLSTIPVFEIDGRQILTGQTEDGQDLTYVKHPLALLSGLAQGSLITDDENGDYFAQLLWDAKPIVGKLRYYDNLLYLFALMALGGKYNVI
ncbi:hypothetical protein Hs30E_10960 [Lactococcus hodotermopsidis]|uniref:Xylanase n=1 Tax=Pseudolactococcus hodotermopsidis TaxID=2709157 RepID=A0A6A0BD11_9LACT|nr:glycosyl hydrolase family 8 [Lactococcus hodotermopsidis]GFH42545.1 hypothetical protein Hs30E_10960 [Lactococcus hodotermopsidis]